MTKIHDLRPAEHFLKLLEFAAQQTKRNNKKDDMTTNDWLTSLDFLTDDERAALRAKGYDHPDAILGEDPGHLASTTGLPVGRCRRVVNSASGYPPQRQDTHYQPLPPDGHLTFGEATPFLRQLGGHMHAIAAAKCRALGFARVTVDEAGRLSEEWLAKFLQDNAPPGDHYGEMRVVNVEDVGTRRLHHPRTGEQLTQVDPIPWITLGPDKLIVAAAIFMTPSVLGNDSDRAVFNDVSEDGPMARSVKGRLGGQLGADARVRVMPERTHAGGGKPSRPSNEQLRVIIREAVARNRGSREDFVTIPFMRAEYGDDESQLAERAASLATEMGYAAELRPYRGSGCDVILRSGTRQL